MKYTQKQIDRRTSDYICRDCGIGFLTEEQKKETRITTAHESHCGLCGKLKTVTHIRNWNYLRLNDKK